MKLTFGLSKIFVNIRKLQNFIILWVVGKGVSWQTKELSTDFRTNHNSSLK